ncbi:MAG TPA: FAD-binding protein [Gaiellaceae bacterium]|nr:FAD-binding protein [Gaiellaceae bacterium]
MRRLCVDRSLQTDAQAKPAHPEGGIASDALTIAGAGMAGLSATARARELGAEPVVFEKGDRPGGSMLLSSGVVWRFREFEEFRAECPAGDEKLQRVVYDRLDEALEWLESLGAPVVDRSTGNPRTSGVRFDPAGLTKALSQAAGPLRLNASFKGSDPVKTAPVRTVLATGGFPVRLARERGLLLRANPWSEGDGLDFARSLGAATAGDLDEFYGRAMPAVEQVDETDFVRLAQLYGRFAKVTADDGTLEFEGRPSWSETDLVQAIARWPGARAWYAVEASELDAKVRERTVAEMIEAAREAGAPVEEADGRVAVLVRPAVTQTLGGLAVDERARVLGKGGSPVDGLYAAGADVGGISNGGWSSGLAAALVFGRIAVEEALS